MTSIDDVTSLVIHPNDPATLYATKKEADHGLWKSTDGFNFELVQEDPVFTKDDIGCPEGTVEDPRLAKYGDTFYMTYVQRNYTPECYPHGEGVPKYVRITHVPEGDPNNYRSGIARSKDLVHWEDMGLMTPPDGFFLARGSDF